MPLHVRPFTRKDAIEDAVAHRRVAPRLVMAENAILLGAQRLNRALRGQVEVVCAQADHFAAKRVERMAEQQTLAAGVDMGALPALRVPGVTDLDAVNRGDDVMITGA